MWNSDDDEFSSEAPTSEEDEEGDRPEYQGEPVRCQRGIGLDVGMVELHEQDCTQNVTWHVPCRMKRSGRRKTTLGTTAKWRHLRSAPPVNLLVHGLHGMQL